MLFTECLVCNHGYSDHPNYCCLIKDCKCQDWVCKKCECTAHAHDGDQCPDMEPMELQQ